MSDLIDLIKLVKPLSKQEKYKINLLKNLIEKQELKLISKFLKQNKISLDTKQINYSFLESPSQKLIITSHSDELINFTKKIQDIIDKNHLEQIKKKFSKDVLHNIIKQIAPNIIGLEDVKKAAALQLFATERFHILLLGDPGTGKTDILRSVNSLAPVSSFGLGSGTSGVGLAVSVKGKEISKGLLPMADKGICCIDELNLMKEESRASLYNAMEKGFVSYDKGGTHIKFDARVRVIATANPVGDKFTGNTVKELRKQLPFDSALLTRFHLVFLIRKPGLEEFKEITKKIVRNKKIEVNKEEISFIKQYIHESEKINVELPPMLEPGITEFVEKLKINESKFLTEISPRLVVGMINMAKASARMNLRKEVNKQDVELVQDIIMHSLKIS